MQCIANCHVIRSSRPDLDIDSLRNISLPQFVMKDFDKYDKHVAMVGVTDIALRIKYFLSETLYLFFA